MIPVVALVGRPNVGKSTLFNALTQTRDALVADRPGVTRDRHYGVCRLQERHFVVVDTGGIAGDADVLHEFTAKQSEAAMDEAALVVLMLDARDGLLPGDRTILDGVRKRGKPFIVVVNKVDGMDDMLVRFGKCCNPIPGDPIVGFITRGRGITIHKADCERAFEVQDERRIEVAWTVNTVPEGVERVVRVRVISQDVPGLLKSMSEASPPSPRNTA